MCAYSGRPGKMTTPLLVVPRLRRRRVQSTVFQVIRGIGDTMLYDAEPRLVLMCDADVLICSDLEPGGCTVTVSPMKWAKVVVAGVYSKRIMKSEFALA